ncbi:MAG: ribonuclease HI [Clostridia bacterium]|nr:ribonuclease HI [Clostridia bacterium]MBQ4448639.1 ribonuclease HI [Clostridia bacterium]
MKRVTIYTDGACSGNPGPGGWAAILMYKDKRRELSGGCVNTTNNRMEMTAAIMALKALKEPCSVDLYTDSAYLSNGFNEHWIDNWVRRGWKKADKKPVENTDLWQELYALSKAHAVTWHKVKGHADNEFNNRCDQMARAEVKNLIESTKPDDDASSVK